MSTDPFTADVLARRPGPAGDRPHGCRLRHDRHGGRDRARHPGGHHAGRQRERRRRPRARRCCSPCCDGSPSSTPTSAPAAGAVPAPTCRASSPACTVGVVGYGGIGRQVAKRLAGFGVELLVHDPMLGADGPVDVDPARRAARPERRGDPALPAAPRAPAASSTPDALSLMQPHAVLVNTSRGARRRRAGAGGGAAVRTDRRRRTRRVPRGAARSARRCSSMPNVVVSPHNGGLSDVSIAEMTRAVRRGRGGGRPRRRRRRRRQPSRARHAPRPHHPRPVPRRRVHHMTSTTASIRVATGPCTWGVDFADAPGNPRWEDVLDDIEQSGIGALELGPVGFLPEDPDTLRANLTEPRPHVGRLVHLRRPARPGPPRPPGRPDRAGVPGDRRVGRHRVRDHRPARRHPRRHRRPARRGAAARRRSAGRACSARSTRSRRSPAATACVRWCTRTPAATSSSRTRSSGSSPTPTSTCASTPATSRSPAWTRPR